MAAARSAAARYSISTGPESEQHRGGAGGGDAAHDQGPEQQPPPWDPRLEARDHGHDEERGHHLGERQDRDAGWARGLEGHDRQRDQEHRGRCEDRQIGELEPHDGGVGGRDRERLAGRISPPPDPAANAPSAADRRTPRHVATA